MIYFFKQKQKQKLLIMGILISLFIIAAPSKSASLSDCFFSFTPWNCNASTVINRVNSNESNINSVGGDIFEEFYYGLGEWLNGGGENGNYPNYQNGIFHKIAEAIKTPFEIGLTLAVVLVALSMYLDVYTKHIRKLIKFAFASVIVSRS